MKLKRAQYQPIQGEGYTLTDAQEVLYSKAFKQADIAGGYRKPRVRAAKQENNE